MFIDFLKENNTVIGYTYSKTIKNLTNIDFSLLDFLNTYNELSEELIELLKIKLSRIINPIILFYMYDIYDDKVISNEKKELILKLINILKNEKYKIFVLLENKIYQYN